jgi:hypothetical protein
MIEKHELTAPRSIVEYDNDLHRGIFLFKPLSKPVRLK